MDGKKQKMHLGESLKLSFAAISFIGNYAVKYNAQHVYPAGWNLRSRDFFAYLP